MKMKELKDRLIRRLIFEWKDRKNISLNMHRDFYRFLTSHSKNKRPTSYPFLSGDSFRALAQHVYDDFDKVKIIHPEKVKEGDIIFVATHYIEKIFKEIHPHIKAKYILITHNGDFHVTSDLLKYIDDKIIHWYAQNVKVSHPKITPIPYGLENLHYHTNGNVGLLKRIINKVPQEKKNKILFGFTITNNIPERLPAYDALIKFPLAEKIQNWPNIKEYLTMLSHYKFVAAPPGNGIDSPREWQAMYLGVVPIVKRSIMTEYFESLNLPMWLINDWNELKKLTTTDLEKRYNDIIAKANTKPLYMDYWVQKILQQK